MARNYKQEGERYGNTPAQIKRRSSRNKARRAAKKAGLLVRPGYDINHKNGNPMDNRPSNLESVPASKNRSYPRTKTARKKNPRD